MATPRQILNSTAILFHLAQVDTREVRGDCVGVCTRHLAVPLFETGHRFFKCSLMLSVNVDCLILKVTTHSSAAKDESANNMIIRKIFFILFIL